MARVAHDSPAREEVRNMLHGRDEERARLASLVAAARAGQAGVLAVLGDPGVGKSALLEDLVTSVQAHQEQPTVLVLTTSGVASEAPLPFAALHRLLRSVIDWHRLPPPQARVLGAVFGHEDGDVPVEPFLVGVATLSVLTDAADDRPVLCVVDDAHWLDAESADALLFAARRMQADRVAMVFAARADVGVGAFRPDSVPVMHLTGLDPAAARRLLEQRVELPPSDVVADRLVAETGGNPLALLELPTELKADQLAGTAALPAGLALTERVERAFLDRIRSASPDVQSLLLLAAADDTGRTSVLHQAATASGVAADAWDEAERAGLLAVAEDRVSVRHPLVRSAVYQAATSFERRHAHAALARALAGDPDRQTWHLAAATIGTDAGVADALHGVGLRAQQRGAHRAAADAFERAAGMTAGEADRAVRLFAAARNAWSSGDAVRAGALCADAAAVADDGVLRADIDRLRGRIEVNVGSAVDAHRIFTPAAERVAVRDPVRALEMAVAAAVARSHGVDSGARLPADAIDVDVSARDSARIRCLKQLLVSTRYDIAGDRGAALTTLHRALDTALSAPDSRGDLDLLGNLGNAALHLGDDDAQRRFYALMLSTARESGDGMTVMYALQRLSFGQYVAGQWTALRDSSEEAIALGRSVGQGALTVAPQAWLTLLAALQGRPDYDARLVAIQEQVHAHPPVGIFAQPVQDLIRWAKAIAALSAGNPTAALHQFRQMQLPALTLIAATDRLEAAVRADDHAQANAWVEDLEAFGAGTALAWARAAAAFGRALTSQSDAADGGDAVSALYEASLAHHGAAERPYDRARVQLAYGEFLRRNQRRIDARSHLRAALETFQDL
ncbi:ATP-binding protein, partial [Actinoplanes sp. NPDC051633]|uniref:ATP-binding protein n=1 Tax=Actinoplanes sp. NPDC051633 TaxID=3155670 RepID=UPI00341E8635